MRIGQTGEKKATQEKRHKTDKEKEDSTDTAAKRQVAQDQSKVKRHEDRKKEGHAAERNEQKSRIRSTSAPVTSMDRHTSTNTKLEP